MKINAIVTQQLIAVTSYFLFELSVSFPFRFVPSSSSSRRLPVSKLSSDKNEWGIGDNWSDLWNFENEAPDVELSTFRSPYDPGKWSNGNDVASYEPTPDDILIDDAVHSIHQNSQHPSDPPLYDTAASFESYLESENFLDKAAKEIAMLVRCNESPDRLLIEEGRKLEPLSDAERYDVDWLVTSSDDDDDDGRRYAPTKFLNDSVSEIFREHARPPNVSTMTTNDENGVVLDSKGIASWMSKCLDEKVGLHDKRVALVRSRYSSYGTGYLTSTGFRKLYLDAVLSGIEDVRHDFGTKDSTYRRVKLTEPDVSSVWRDFKAHGIMSPAEEQYEEKRIEMDSKLGLGRNDVGIAKGIGATGIFDECEILDWGVGGQGTDEGTTGNIKRRSSDVDFVEKSSHELVELANDNKTPKRLRDGEFVFIDENSCIGCTRCALTAPSTFKMLDNGRARTFSQSNSPEVAQAVGLCPVNCMHNMSFRELKEMESARDHGDGRTDHRHMGSNTRPFLTPLNVERSCSDANHKSSWYHYLKQKCYISKSCPQKGCYDCPLYREKGGNPYFQLNHRKANHVRVLSLIECGEANKYRRFVEL